ncbi:cell surface immobilization antigen (macronuclear) [Tetrahymena thermophila SB210]|uniref:Cell surface immobilization antigen n=1 Tax=Tetrahymena thermophila (strain SB210) TaxID=312017 RepID=Q231X7_TETTS|nr:cell surface immobilization antigen [Tetrahymena thermophila SB210]EAR91323.1 cell surface immobilization antigen [Tetrahymena thermophila SB210]|eukprot:XP_001011568.1 cell surface immobilization antigen [Tetrahymena thermophila SB210]
MRQITLFVLFCFITICFAQNQGMRMIKCQKNGVCNDENCGKSGTVPNNWAVTLENCSVADCSKLTGNGAIVSTNACTSCFQYDTPYANYNNTLCVKTSAKLLAAASSMIVVAFLFLF